MDVLGVMSDCDTLLLAIAEFWDDNAIEVWVNEFFRRLLRIEPMSAEVAFTNADDVLVFGVVGVEYS